MANTVVVGAQWGDEAKGKMVDYLAQRAGISLCDVLFTLDLKHSNVAETVSLTNTSKNLIASDGEGGDIDLLVGTMIR